MINLIPFIVFQQYNFLVTVWDQMHSGSVNVTIDILDVNDNAPKVDDYNFLTFKENDYSIVGVIATVSFDKFAFPFNY